MSFGRCVRGFWRHILVYTLLVTDNNKVILDFLVFSEKKQLREVQMSRSEITSRDLRDLQTEMRRTKFAAERGSNFLIGLCNQLYPMLDIELLKKACPQVISAEPDWLFKRSKTYRLFFFLHELQ